MNYDILIIQPTTEMMVKVTTFLPKFLIALSILIIGWIITRLVEKMITEVLKAVKFDNISERLGLTRILDNGGVRRKPSTLLGYSVYLVMMVMVLITTVKALGFHAISTLIDTTLSYIPNVITGVLMLIIGMLLAKVVSGLIFVTAKNTDMPIPDTLAKLSKLAIIAYVTIIFLKEIGLISLFVGTHYTIFIAGIVFAMALSFGLAGRNVAAKYLEVLNMKKTTS